MIKFTCGITCCICSPFCVVKPFVPLLDEAVTISPFDDDGDVIIVSWELSVWLELEVIAIKFLCDANRVAISSDSSNSFFIKSTFSFSIK